MKMRTVIRFAVVAFCACAYVASVPAMAQPAKAATTTAGKKTLTKTQALSNPISVIQTFTENDLQAALADAQANNDTVSAPCYQALLTLAKTNIANPFPTGFGAFQALQKARDAKALLASIQSQNGPLTNLNVACAPLILDAQTTLVQLGILTGGVVAVGASGGLALPALPALSALIPGL